MRPVAFIVDLFTSPKWKSLLAGKEPESKTAPNV